MNEDARLWMNLNAVGLALLSLFWISFSASAVSCGHTKTKVYSVECIDASEPCEYVRRNSDGDEIERISVFEAVSRGFDVGINQITLDRFVECCQEE